MSEKLVHLQERGLELKKKRIIIITLMNQAKAQMKSSFWS